MSINSDNSNTSAQINLTSSEQGIKYLSFCNSFSHREFKIKRGEREGMNLHHIIPRSLNGSDKRDNLVLLTREEHAQAHLLLALALGHVFKKLWNLRGFYEFYSETELNTIKEKAPKHFLSEETIDKFRKLRSEANKREGILKLGAHLSEETKEKISQTLKDKGVNKGVKNGMSNKDIWDNYDEYYMYWLLSGKPPCTRMAKMLNKPRSTFKRMIEKFKEINKR